MQIHQEEKRQVIGESGKHLQMFPFSRLHHSFCVFSSIHWQAAKRSSHLLVLPHNGMEKRIIKGKSLRTRKSRERQFNKKERDKTKKMKNKSCKIVQYQLTNAQQISQKCLLQYTTLHSFIVQHDIIYYGIILQSIWVSCPGCVLPLIPVYLQPFTIRRAQELEKSLSYYKHCSITTKTSVCYQPYSHPKSK